MQWLNEICFMRGVFRTGEENQKQCVIMEDEIYVKKCCYIVGELYANDDPQSVAKVLLIVGGPIFFQNWICHFFMNK